MKVKMNHGYDGGYQRTEMDYLIINERKAFPVFPAEIFDWSRAEVSV